LEIHSRVSCLDTESEFVQSQINPDEMTNRAMKIMDVPPKGITNDLTN